MSSDNTQGTRNDPRTHLTALLKDLHTVMVATRSATDVMHARPMAIAEVTDNGEVWFVTDRRSGKVDEITGDSRGLVTGQKGNEMFSVNGALGVVDDRARLDRLWSDAWKIWFSGGKDDPNIVLLRFVPTVGEYWDQRGSKSLRYLFEAAKAYVTGEKIDVRAAGSGEDGHAKVRM